MRSMVEGQPGRAVAGGWPPTPPPAGPGPPPRAGRYL